MSSLQDGSVHIGYIWASFLDIGRKWRHIIHLYVLSFVFVSTFGHWQFACCSQARILKKTEGPCVPLIHSSRNRFSKSEILEQSHPEQIFFLVSCRWLHFKRLSMRQRVSVHLKIYIWRGTDNTNGSTVHHQYISNAQRTLYLFTACLKSALCSHTQLETGAQQEMASVFFLCS